jgi:hypothetical protein
VKLRTAAVLCLGLGALAGAYAKWARPRILNWGARPDEITRPLPGDEVLPEVCLQTTRAVTVDASPEHIWPWLLQMGMKPRAGVYTYDWIERLLGLDVENSDRILPEFQHLEPGEYLGVDKKGQGIVVRQVLSEQAIVLQWTPAQSTWTFALYPEEGRTRLISRNRIVGKGPMFWIMMAGFMEAASLVMERKMLLGIKDRAERLARERVAALA